MRASPALLLVRPRPQSERFARAARARLGADLAIVIAPLMELRPLALTVDARKFAGLIFTSENGVAAFAGQCALRARPVWCVGSRTAAAARAAGFRNLRSAAATGGDAEALIARILKDAPKGPLLHLRGTHARVDIAARLSAQGLPCEAAVVYDQISQPLGAEALRLLEAPAPVLLPLFSPRSARLMAEAINGHAVRAALHIVAISPAAAAPWYDSGRDAGAGLPAMRAEAMHVAPRPDARAVLDLLEGIVTSLAP